MLLLSVFPTAGHFHLSGTGSHGTTTVHAGSPAGNGHHHQHDPFHCIIHLIAASFASIEQSSAVTFPSFTAHVVAIPDVVAGERILFTTTDVRGPPAHS